MEVLCLQPSSQTCNATNCIGSTMCDWKVWHKEKHHQLATGVCPRYVNKSWIQFFRFSIFCCQLFGDDSNLWYGIECAHGHNTRRSYGQGHYLHMRQHSRFLFLFAKASSTAYIGLGSHCWHSQHGIHIFQAFGFMLDPFQDFFFVSFWFFFIRTHS